MAMLKLRTESRWSLPSYTMTAAELGVYAQQLEASLKEIGINIKLDCILHETLLGPSYNLPI